MYTLFNNLMACNWVLTFYDSDYRNTRLCTKYLNGVTLYFVFLLHGEYAKRYIFISVPDPLALSGMI